MILAATYILLKCIENILKPTEKRPKKCYYPHLLSNFQFVFVMSYLIDWVDQNEDENPVKSVETSHIDYF